MKNTIQKTAIRIFSVLFAALLAASSLSAASPPVSPALSILARDVQMVKSGLLYSDITFTPIDFERALGVGSVRSVTITSIPEAAEGSLKLGEKAVCEGDVIARKDIGTLRFVPASGDVRESRFTFSTNHGPHTVTCLLFVLDKMNFAPTTALSGENSLYIETSKGVSYFGVLSALDPENDALTFDIVTEPEHGTLTLKNKQSGDFKYTPDPDHTGKDSFSYTVRDRYGNYSDITRVTVRVNKSASLVFADMSGHWAEGAALEAAKKGIMGGRVVGAETYFYPDEEVSRADFLVMLMRAAGIDDVAECSATIFTDDDEISKEAKGYVAEALARGYVHGSYTQSGIFFNPNDNITRAEAAVMINNILDAKVPAILPVFSDIDSIPAWARGAFYSLSPLGIFNGTGSGNISPNHTITRAQAAKILSAVSDAR